MISTRDAAVDCGFLSLVTVLSIAFYVGDLGFYYDDYSLLGRMHLSEDQSIVGLYESVRPALGQRPIAAGIFAVLYWLFGTDPLGYHIVNSGLLIAVSVVLYLVLRELRLPRLIAVALPLVYVMLPHYATERFWMDLVGVNLSTALYLLSLYAALRAVRASSAAALFAWIAIAVLGVGVMMYTYELFAPLVLLNVVLVWWAAQTGPRPGASRRAVFLTTGSLIAVLVATGVAKLVGVSVYGQNGYEVGLESGVLHHLAYVVAGIVKVNIGTYFLAFPYVLWWIVRHEFSFANAAVAALVGLAVFAFLWRIGRRDRDFFEIERGSRVLIAVGVVAFVLGYAIFLTTESVAFRSAGIDNRVNVGAAMGVAAVLIGAFGWIAARLDERRGLLAFCAATAVAVAASTFVIQSLSSFWTRAAQRQEEIVTGVKQEAGALPASTTVILDGSCPEVGPAVVFADNSDLRSALRLEYDDATIKADVASEALRANGQGLTLETTLFGRRFTRSYPYRRLIVYNFASRRLYHLLDRADAEAYLARSRPSFRCPPQRSFAWGFDPFKRWSLL
jgi:hypothetical protein